MDVPLKENSSVVVLTSHTTVHSNVGFVVMMSQTAVHGIIDTLWMLMGAGVEELKLLQTVILLITTTSIVRRQALSKVSASSADRCSPK